MHAVAEVSEDVAALYKAIGDQDEEAVSAMMGRGVNPNVDNQSRKMMETNPFMVMFSPIGRAAALNNTVICSHLLKAGADVNNGGRSAHFPLYMAAKHCNLTLVKLLLSYKPNLNLQYVTGNTALVEAVHHYDEEIVRELIEAGCDLHIPNNAGDSALHVAALKGNKNIVQILLSAGMNPNHSGTRIMKNKPAKYKAAQQRRTKPLHMAAFGRHTEVARILLEHGADVNAAFADGRTCLHIAAMTGNTSLARLLLECECEMDPVSTDNEEHKTPLMKAVDSGHNDMVELLIQSGADMDTCDHWGVTPLINAIWKQNRELIKLLIVSGCDVNKKSLNGMDAFRAALEVSDPIIVAMLIQGGYELTNEKLTELEDSTRVYPLLHLDQHKDFQGQLFQIAGSVTSLQQSCRMAIRRELVPNPVDKVTALPLPSKLMQYLSMVDIDQASLL